MRMRTALVRTVTVLTSAVGLTVIAWIASPHHPDPPAKDTSAEGTLPAGWIESCTWVVLGDVCHAYPPGDRRWEPAVPLPPRLPLVLPTGSR